MELKGKTILITGGKRVGQVVARELAAAGAQIIMTYLGDESEVAAGARGYQLDLSQEDSIHKLTTTFHKEKITIDALINMASIFVPDPPHISAAEIHKIFSINAFGTMLLSDWFATQARQRNATNVPIISFIDWAVDHPYANHAIYLASKAALRHYLMALQTSFAGTIRVVNIHPGMILEPPDFSQEEKKEIINNTPTKTIGDPMQAAQLVKAALTLDFWADNVFLAGGQQWRHRL